MKKESIKRTAELRLILKSLEKVHMVKDKDELIAREEGTS
jgi:hypothetical protein